MNSTFSSSPGDAPQEQVENPGKRKSGGSAEENEQKLKRRAQIAKAARKHRQRQKEELTYLRSQVKTLEEDIEVLNAEKPSQQPKDNDGWKKEAHVQSEIRARIDRENEYLRHTLVEQLKFTQGLQNLIASQPLLASSSRNENEAADSALALLMNESASSSETISIFELDNEPPQEPPQPLTPQQIHENHLLSLASQLVSRFPSQVEEGDIAFSISNKKSLCYMGVQVQYEVGETDLSVYLRQTISDIQVNTMASTIWSASQDKTFIEGFPFITSFEVLRFLDENTIYTKHIYLLNHSSGLQAESLGIMVRKNEEDQVIFCSQTVDNDPDIPAKQGIFRQDATYSIIVRKDSENPKGCQLMWCIRTKSISDNAGENVSSTLSKYVFENTPRWFSAMIDRARFS